MNGTAEVTEHTPYPYRVIKGRHESVEVLAPQESGGDTHVATFWHTNGVGSVDANVARYLAIPELLAALKAAVPILNVYAIDPDERQVLKAALAAIAKTEVVGA